MTPRNVRLAAIGATCLVIAAVGTWTLGLWPLVETPRATVDHCYVTYDRQEQQHSRCVGHWTRFGHHVSGSIRGIAVPTSWPAVTEQPDENYEWEVQIPSDLPKPRVFAYFHEAWVLSPRLGAWLWIPPVLLGLLIGWGIDMAGRTALRRVDSAYKKGGRPDGPDRVSP
jgi:hypothetical protein